VVDAGLELELGWFEGIVWWEGEEEFEFTALLWMEVLGFWVVYWWDVREIMRTHGVW
jgi:hypothetical protein